MKRGLFALAILLAGCVPPGVRSVESAPKRANDPRIEPDLGALLLDQQPVWEARPVKPAAISANGQRYHIVASGESGIAIARAYGIPWQRIVTANALSEPFILNVGQRLILPGSAAPGIEARAAAFKIDIDDIASGGTPAKTVALAIPDPPKFGGRFVWPVAGIVAERFGPVGEGHVNRGIEIIVAPASDIRAAADGVVAFVGNGGSAGYGGLILIRHSDGWISAYGRAWQANVARGQIVKTGDIIGRVGDGAKPQVHFELRRNRLAVDPGKYLPPM